MPFSGPKISVTGGPKTGEEFSLEEAEYVVGRSQDNPICIPDTSVSRKHIMLRRVGSGWTVSDLGSGNGTLVNGEPISDETVLANGDVITMGDTELTFSDTANATMMVAVTPSPSRPRPAASGAAGRPRPERVRPGRGPMVKAVDPNAQKKKKLAIAAGALVLLLAAAGLVLIRKQQDAVAAEHEAEAMAVAAERKQVGAVFQDAKNLIREGRWADAKERLLELQQMAPDMGALKDYLERVEKEIPNQEHLSAAQTALQAKKLAEAKTALDKVTPDTQMYEQVIKLKRDLRDTADAQAREARTLLDSKQLEPARQSKAIVEDVLAVFTEHRDAKLILEEADRLIYEITKPPPPPVVIVKDPWEQAQARFIDGDLSGAVALANACMTKSPKCKNGLKDMTDFGNMYKKLEDLDAKGLARLLALDREITGSKGPSKMARNAGTRAANIFYKSASAAKAAGQWARAVEYSRRTLQADPGHAGASNILSDLKAKAKDLYFMAYALKDANPEDAIPKFREVIAMTPADDEHHKKAKNWIAQLSR